ncbi:MAG: Heat-inducible transcription repressor HrcA [Acidimicrobiales bacterium]|nr:MAG: heat-inducible transcription repressor HrcA [Actinomycetota bacterium]MBV6507568.1 Heat-inducible transcription repressor HrcA [Acidimicrobiales bacterium]RIK07506.1 MAG: heat-inducible transcription repressor HrcA [Acidobacteriota bacterium]
MLDDRKSSILRAVVQRYIETAQPVGSGAVVATSDVRVSSATVRNEMAVLEADGYLIQPHTSAGRVPTEKGYRFFVDSLKGRGSLDLSQSQQVRSFFARAHGELENMLRSTVHLLSTITDNTAVVVQEGSDRSQIRSVQLVPLTSTVTMIVLVTSSGVVHKPTIEVLDVGDEVTAAVTALLSTHLVGTPVRRLVDSLPGTGNEDVDTVAAAALEAVRCSLNDHAALYVDGAAHMAEAFETVETIRDVLNILEQQLVVVSLIQDVLDRGLTVAIGTETGVEPLAGCALVVAPYEVEGEHAGTIGLLGPTRMNYSEALAAVALVSRRLGRTLSEG